MKDNSNLVSILKKKKKKEQALFIQKIGIVVYTVNDLQSSMQEETNCLSFKWLMTVYDLGNNFILF